MTEGMTAFEPGDRVQLLHRGKPTGRTAIVREIQEHTGCIVADLIDKAPDDFPIYDLAECFILAE